MKILNEIINALVTFSNWFWGIPVLILIGGGGLIICFVIGWPQLRHMHYINGQTFGKMFAKTEKKEGAVSPFAAACTALASSIGASNIVGVPVAIAMGGPGAVFWIWILAIVGMGTKYVEVALGIRYRVRNEKGELMGGPYYYCKSGFKEMAKEHGKEWLAKFGVVLGTIYAFFLMLEIFTACATQSASCTNQFVAYGIDQKVIAAVVAVIVAVVCIGGVKRIASVCDKMVPFMATIYLVGGLVLILMNIKAVPEAFALIFKDAFTGEAAVGGFGGASMAMAIRWGAARGVYSNEAGMGTAPQGHAAADVDHPIRQAMWGVFEVTVDTLIVCSITALAILTTGVWKLEDATKNQAALAQDAFRSGFGAGFADLFIAVCVFLFVLSTIIVIVFYGERQAEFLFGMKFSKVWRWVYIIATFLGGLGLEIETLWALTDFFTFLYVLPNMTAVILLSPQVRRMEKEFFHTKDRYYLADVAAKHAAKSK